MNIEPNQPWEAQTHYSPERRGFLLFLWSGAQRGRVEREEVEDGAYAEPSVRLTREAAQKLMDSLWDCGLRPVGAAGSAGQLDAVQKHLGDMRRLTFTTLEVTEP